MAAASDLVQRVAMLCVAGGRHSHSAERLAQFQVGVRSLDQSVDAALRPFAGAHVLSDMDTELDALQQRLAKTQKIKQGMMQELLTGKTRLV